MFADFNQIIVFTRVKPTVFSVLLAGLGVGTEWVFGLIKHLFALADHVREEFTSLLHY